MPRSLALLLTCAFVFYLFRRDIKERPNISGAQWIPLTWFLIVGSRPVTEWLALVGIHVPGSLEEGNPVERLVSLALLVAGALVLSKRQTSVVAFVKSNVWITLYLLFCLLAISWSDYMFVSFKRWTRAFGEPVMVLLILTEVDRVEAITRLMKRAAYVLMPFSIMLIKYFPELGKRFTMWGGGESIGATDGKNTLGRVCMILGFFLFCHLLKTFRQPKGLPRRKELILTGVLLWTIWWNLIESSSSTSLMSLIVGMLMVLILRAPGVSRRYIGVYIAAGSLFLFTADALFGVYEGILHLLGREASLTGRTELWADLLNMDIDPLFGTGFESFWLGERLRYLWSRHWWRPNEAHNGYLEIYLNLGLIGLSVVLCVMLATYRKARRTLLEDFEQGCVRLGCLAGVIVYNWTEAGLRPMGSMLFAFYLIAIDYPLRRSALNSQVWQGESRDGRPCVIPSALYPASISNRRANLRGQRVGVQSRPTSRRDTGTAEYRRSGSTRLGRRSS